MDTRYKLGEAHYFLRKLTEKEDVTELFRYYRARAQLSEKVENPSIQQVFKTNKFNVSESMRARTGRV